MEELIGPMKRHNWYVLACLTSYYATIMVVGVIGNLVTIWAIKYTSDLQTTSNKFILNLAKVDLATLMFGKYAT